MTTVQGEGDGVEGDEAPGTAGENDGAGTPTPAPQNDDGNTRGTAADVSWWQVPPGNVVRALLAALDARAVALMAHGTGKFRDALMVTEHAVNLAWYAVTEEDDAQARDALRMCVASMVESVRGRRPDASLVAYHPVDQGHGWVTRAWTEPVRIAAVTRQSAVMRCYRRMLVCAKVAELVGFGRRIGSRHPFLSSARGFTLEKFERNVGEMAHRPGIEKYAIEVLGPSQHTPDDDLVREAFGYLGHEVERFASIGRTLRRRSPAGNG